MKIETAFVNDIEMPYFSFGTGERAFIILPGDSAKSITLSARAIEAAYKQFGEKYTVYAFDRRRNMPAEYSIEEMADDTAVVMKHLGIKDADIFGASQGGMIAMCIAISDPELVHAMALGSTTTCGTPETEEAVVRWIELAQARDLTGLTGTFIDNLFSENTLGKYRDILLHMNDDIGEDDIRRFIIQTKALIGFDIRDRLAGISCPILTIGCKGDKLIPYQASLEIAALTGGESYLYGEEFGHCVFDEAPDYKDRMLDFFEKHHS